MATDPARLPFNKAISYFRQKVSLPTERWNDLLRGEHTRAFVVAGATKDELLSDLRSSIDKAIAQGTTLDQFRKEFDQIVGSHGWSYKGGRGWRTNVMLTTNIRTAYQAGRYSQMTDPDVLKVRPFWEYRHGDSRDPRPEHLSWDGLVLPASDPWWNTHYTPNGWGCTCKVRALSARDLAKRGKTEPDKAPASRTYEWTDKTTGEIHDIPVGIDPGWDYNVGKAAWGEPEALRIMRGGSLGDKIALTAGDWVAAGRPAKVPTDPFQGKLLTSTRSATEWERRLEGVLGGPEAVFSLTITPEFELGVLVVASVLAEVISPADSQYLGLLPEVLTNPFEVWLAFEEDPDGRVVLRTRYIKGVAIGRGRTLTVSLSARKGMLESVDFGQLTQAEVNGLRRGQLIYARP